MVSTPQGDIADETFATHLSPSQVLQILRLRLAREFAPPSLVAGSTRMLTSNTLAHRLTPIAHLNQRICLATTLLPTGGGLHGKSPLLIGKGDIVELNIRAMQRDKSFWGPDAEEFRPDRWTSVRPMWQYIPFGGGPRVCPGMRLVWTECAFVVTTMARQFSEVQNRDTEMEWIEEIRMTAQSKNGTKVALVVDMNTT